MPHKYNTRITSGALLSKKYTSETGDSSDESISDTESSYSSYSTNSYVSNTNTSAYFHNC